MVLPAHWATVDDFATLFQYLWHRDFPLGQGSVGARRADWTIHIGIVVRGVADLMGLVTRFERGGRKDAVLRSAAGDEIVVEWEWNGAWENELGKLKQHRLYNPDKSTSHAIRYAVFITYADTQEVDKTYWHVGREWCGAQYPLLLVLVETADSKTLTLKKEFRNIHFSVFERDGGQKVLKASPAYPWDIQGSKWSVQVPEGRLRSIEAFLKPQREQD